MESGHCVADSVLHRRGVNQGELCMHSLLDAGCSFLMKCRLAFACGC